MNGLDIIARVQAMPMTHKVVTHFADGTTREFPVRSIGAGENYAVGEKRKIGKTLINRETGASVQVINVTIEAL